MNLFQSPQISTACFIGKETASSLYPIFMPSVDARSSFTSLNQCKIQGVRKWGRVLRRWDWWKAPHLERNQQPQKRGRRGFLHDTEMGEVRVTRIINHLKSNFRSVERDVGDKTDNSLLLTDQARLDRNYSVL